MSFPCYSHLTTDKKLSCRLTASDAVNPSYRTEYDRDRDRILHSDSFRRLNHKTQVVFDVQNDHIRTRLTHSLEVSQIARTIARYFNLDESLTEAISLAHDIGHPPFGHKGENALNDALRKHSSKGFYHNDQTLRAVCLLETRPIDKSLVGLDLTFACIEGIAKHNGKIDSKTQTELPSFIEWYEEYNPPFVLATQASLEAQIAAVSDDIAYISHDLDDALRSSAIPNITVTSVKDWPLVKTAMTALDIPENVTLERIRHPLTRKLIDLMVSDVISTTKNNIENNHIKTYQDVIAQDQPTVGFSQPYKEQTQELKNKLDKNYWQCEYIQKQEQPLMDVINRLFCIYMERPSLIKGETEEESGFYHPDMDKINDQEVLPTIVSDYIAGMTDRFALKQFEKIVTSSSDHKLLKNISRFYTSQDKF